MIGYEGFIGIPWSYLFYAFVRGSLNIPLGRFCVYFGLLWDSPECSLEHLCGVFAISLFRVILGFLQGSFRVLLWSFQNEGFLISVLRFL